MMIILPTTMRSPHRPSNDHQSWQGHWEPRFTVRIWLLAKKITEQLFNFQNCYRWTIYTNWYLSWSLGCIKKNSSFLSTAKQSIVSSGFVHISADQSLGLQPLHWCAKTCISLCFWDSYVHTIQHDVFTSCEHKNHLCSHVVSNIEPFSHNDRVHML